MVRRDAMVSFEAPDEAEERKDPDPREHESWRYRCGMWYRERVDYIRGREQPAGKLR